MHPTERLLPAALKDLQAVAPEALSPSAVSSEFRRLLDRGFQLQPAGDARRHPRQLLELGYTPKSKVHLFDTDFYFSRPRQNPDLRFFVVYLVSRREGAPAVISPRIVYKDISLIWRAASHIFIEGDELWIGKGDTRTDRRGDYDFEESAEWTTDLPFEIQTALESLNRVRHVRQDFRALPLVLRRASHDRIRAFADFTGPRQRARNQGLIVCEGEKVVYFRRHGDPTSLRVRPGFEPDWRNGVVENFSSRSRLYGGAVRRFRVVSRNRIIQHLFFFAARHSWMIPPQATTLALSNYGVRTVDVNHDEEAYVPGFEYHFEEAEGEGFHSQIPEGYAGEPSEIDDSRADASAWLDQIPLLVEARRRLL